MTKADEKSLKQGYNLTLARIAAGYPTVSAAARALRVARRTLEDHEKGRRGFSRKADTYAGWYKTTITALLATEPVKGIIDIPHIDFTALGQNTLEELLASTTQTMLRLFKCDANCFSLINPDWAMTAEVRPRIFPGDILVFDPTSSAASGDCVLALVPGHALPIVRIYKPKRRGGATFSALSPDIAQISTKPASLWKILGRLKFIARSGENIL